MIEVQDLTHRYITEGRGETLALSDVNLTIESNEFITLLGPSGCGKTTLMRAIGGLENPTEGTVEVNGSRVDGPNLDCSVVFQNFALMPWATILDNTAFGLEMRGRSKREAREIAMEYIEKVGLTGFEDKYPKELSGGMQQRVGLARALAVDTPVILMDEPFGALDQQTRRYMQEELLKIWENNKKTVVFVTHDMEEAVLLADRVVLMSARPGRVEEVIPVDIPRPRNEEGIERTPQFVDLKEYLWQRLREMYRMGVK